MTRLIDADSLEPYYRLMQDNATGVKMMALPDGIVDQQPTVDAVPVIRCKDCAHWDCSDDESYCDELGIFDTDMNSYCSYAKRKEK